MRGTAAYTIVKSGETRAPSCAERAAALTVPLTLGATARVQIPHQHMILDVDVSALDSHKNNLRLTRQSREGGATKPRVQPARRSEPVDPLGIHKERTSIGLSFGAPADL